MSVAQNLLDNIDAILLAKEFAGTFSETGLNPTLLNLLTVRSVAYAINSAETVTISGTLPAFASPPTVNIGTAPNLTITNTSFIATQSTAANLNATVVFASPQAVTQSGTWTTARSWSLASGSDSVAIGGTLPAFASPPTVNIGTAPNLAITNTSFIATQSTAANLNATVVFASPQAVTQSGTWTTARSWSLASGSDSVAIGGTLPAFASPPAVTINGTPLVVGQGFRSSTLINRSSALSYPANGVIGGLFTLANIGIAGESILLHNLTLFYRTATIPSGLTVLHVYLYSAAPSSFADRATWSMSDADEALILNAEPIVLAVVAGGGRLRAVGNTLNIEAIMTSANLVGYVVTPNAFTPNATTEVLSVTARSWRN